MKRGRGAAIGVGIIAVCLALYFVLTLQFSWLLITQADPIGVAIGVVLIVFPVAAAVFVGRELFFGFQASHLLRRMEAEDALPIDDLPKRPSGATERSAADEEFPRWRAEVEAAPDDWRAWYRLGLAYDAAGDRRRARGAVRRAITLERSERRSR